MDSHSSYDRAVRRVDQKIGFYVHLAVYVLVNAMLVAIDLTKSPQDIWFFWPLGGWGLGVALHAWKVFGNSGPSKLKQRMIQRELEREEQSASVS